MQRTLHVAFRFHCSSIAAAPLQLLTINLALVCCLQTHAYVQLACQPASQHCFSLTPNQYQPPTSNQPAILFSDNKSAPATGNSQPKHSCKPSVTLPLPAWASSINQASAFKRADMQLTTRADRLPGNERARGENDWCLRQIRTLL